MLSSGRCSPSVGVRTVSGALSRLIRAVRLAFAARAAVSEVPLWPSPFHRCFPPVFALVTHVRHPSSLPFFPTQCAGTPLCSIPSSSTAVAWPPTLRCRVSPSGRLSCTSISSVFRLPPGRRPTQPPTMCGGARASRCTTWTDGRTPGGRGRGMNGRRGETRAGIAGRVGRKAVTSGGAPQLPASGK